MCRLNLWRIEPLKYMMRGAKTRLISRALRLCVSGSTPRLCIGACLLPAARLTSNILLDSKRILLPLYAHYANTFDALCLQFLVKPRPLCFWDQDPAFPLNPIPSLGHFDIVCPEQTLMPIPFCSSTFDITKVELSVSDCRVLGDKVLLIVSSS